MKTTTANLDEVAPAAKSPPSPGRLYGRMSEPEHGAPKTHSPCVKVPGFRRVRPTISDEDDQPPAQGPNTSPQASTTHPALDMDRGARERGQILRPGSRSINDQMIRHDAVGKLPLGWAVDGFSVVAIIYPSERPGGWTGSLRLLALARDQHTVEEGARSWCASSPTQEQ
ncbi:hypothetical protein LX32DRAFT_691335 [Colletotrichum zoysiae]|uniref:Uncharacterized protein n=1 Tax=Colletotrichum zoysiae TaxID=1216348 RepID=A0AAD9HPH4_9PEZI|nr:hypothetical protein LX32DRAFT_691335 [Colletotrichum zoysiae]